MERIKEEGEDQKKVGERKRKEAGGGGEEWKRKKRKEGEVKEEITRENTVSPAVFCAG